MGGQDFFLQPADREYAAPQVISPVMATSLRTGILLRADTIEVAIVIPADGPSLGMAPSGTCTWMSRFWWKSGSSPSCCAGADVAQGRLRRLLHDLAKLSGDGHLALAGHDHGFDPQNVASELGPGKSHGKADFVFFFGPPVMEFRNPEEFLNMVFGKHHPGFRPVAHHFLGHLAADRADFALQVPDPRLLCVMADDVEQYFIGEVDIVRAYAVCLALLFDQEVPGDIELLQFGVAGKLDDFHPVPKRGGMECRVLAVVMKKTSERS